MIKLYKRELLIGLCWSVITGLAHWLFSFFPTLILQDIVNPLLNAALIALSSYGAFLLWNHYDGVRVRRMWAISLLFWNIVAALFLVVQIKNTFFDAPLPTRAWGWEVSIGDFLGWLLLIYPTEILRPHWLNGKRALAQLAPIPLIAVLEWFVGIDLRALYFVYIFSLIFLQTRHLRAYRLWCEEHYSSMKDIDAEWIVFYFIMLTIIFISFMYVSFFPSPAHTVVQQLLLLIVLGYSTEQILFRPDPWKQLETEFPSTEDEKGALPNDEQFDSYRLVLEQWMQNEKPYLNPDFKLLDLRQVLPLNRTYLSQLINKEYNCNFYQFVTKYRIDEAMRLMKEHPDIKMQEVAERSGFSSSTVFGRTFSRETGQTPHEWSSNLNNS